jgi:hypothetical protein
VTTFGDIRRWSAVDLEETANRLLNQSHALLGLQDELDGSTRTLLWTGEAAAAAGRAHDNMGDRLRRLVAQVSAVRTALDEASASVEALRRSVAEVDFFAARYQFSVGDDAVVRDQLPPGEPLSDGDVEDRARACTEIVDRIEQILRTAADVDSDLAAVLNAAAEDTVADGVFPGLDNASRAGADAGHLTVGGPPAGGTPFDNAGYWNSLSGGQQADVLAQHPDWVGNLDGIPATVRNQANTSQLDGERAALHAEAVRLQTELDGAVFGSAFSNADAGLELVRAKIASIDAISTVMDRGSRQLLLLDLSGTRATAAIAYGNVDTADHVSVFTPGLNSTVDGNMASYDDQNRLLRVQAQEQSDRYGAGATVATVTWIGYPAPQAEVPGFPGILNPFEVRTQLGSVLDAATDDVARGGAERLSSFLDGIDASRSFDPHLTALGHSYGSLTTSLALQNGTGVDDAVLFGSPGLGTDDVTTLGLDPGRVYLLEADQDPVADLGAFGADPSGLTGVTNLETRPSVTPDGRPLAGSINHSQYFDDGDRRTVSAYNMATIVAGVPQRAVYGQDLDRGDAYRQTLGDPLRLWPR